MASDAGLQFAGFWRRIIAFGIDSLILLTIRAAILLVFSPEPLSGQEQGNDAAIRMAMIVIAFGYTIGFWCWKQTTPGKHAVGARIVDARTGGEPTLGQFLIRYLGYILPGVFGCVWVAFDERKQGWHDKLARTVVVRTSDAKPVRFEAPPLPS